VIFRLWVWKRGRVSAPFHFWAFRAERAELDFGKSARQNPLFYWPCGVCGTCGTEKGYIWEFAQTPEKGKKNTTLGCFNLKYTIFLSARSARSAQPLFYWVFPCGFVFFQFRTFRTGAKRPLTWASPFSGSIEQAAPVSQLFGQPTRLLLCIVVPSTLMLAKQSPQRLALFRGEFLIIIHV